MNVEFSSLLWCLIGYSLACFGGHFIVRPFINYLWKKSEEFFKEKKVHLPPDPIRPSPTVSFWHGVFERGVYVSCIFSGNPEGIAVWLAFKAVMRWKMSDKHDPRHTPGSPIYMIGTAFNIGIGVIGGLIAKGIW